MKIPTPAEALEMDKTSHTYHFIRPNGTSGFTTLFPNGTDMSAADGITHMYEEFPDWKGHHFKHTHSTVGSAISPNVRPPWAGGPSLSDVQKAFMVPAQREVKSDGYDEAHSKLKGSKKFPISIPAPAPGAEDEEPLIVPNPTLDTTK